MDGVTTPVPEVQLLSGETQWVWVSPHSTSWVNYQFGIGDRTVWFNGKLNVEIQVYENRRLLRSELRRLWRFLWRHVDARGRHARRGGRHDRILIETQ